MCEECEAYLCGDCYDKSIEEYGKTDDDTGEICLDKCIICQKDVVTDDILISYLLCKAGLTREKAEQEVKAGK